MKIDINPSKSILDYCFTFKKKFLENGWPSSKLEPWKMTPLNKFIKGHSELTIKSDYKIISALKKEVFNEIKSENLKLLQTKYFKSNEMSRVIFSNFDNAFEINLPENFSSNEIIDISNFVEDGFWSSSIIIIKIGKNVNANLKFDFTLSSNSLCTPLLTFDINEGANIAFGLNITNKTDSLSKSNFVGIMDANLENNSKLDMVLTQQGVNLSRSDINISLNGDYSTFNLTGIYFGRERQHKDITACVNHNAENTSSKQIIRGILDDSSVGVYQGGIKVAPQAQKTDGQQMSRALLLSKLAESNSKPELEIFAGDVSCAHGATIGELNKEHFFYLLSRGIPYMKARDILIKAYLSEILDDIDNKYLSNQLESAINFWLNKLEENVAA